MILNFLLHTSIVKFAFVGLISTLIDIGLLNLLRRSGAPVYIATGFGFLAGTINGYLLNSLYVFNEVYTAVRYERYFLVSAGGLILTELIIHALHTKGKLLSLNKAKLVAVCIVFFWNYTLSRIWAFT